MRFDGKKAWFMFDNEVVCLGADIRARDNNAEVITVVDNYMTDGGFFADGVRYNEGYCANASYALLEGACGYYFRTEGNPPEICVKSLQRLDGRRSGKEK